MEKRGQCNRKGIGKRAEGYRQEQRAAEYLQEKGYQILECNFYSRYGEIDIIAKDREYLVFVEVKYRKSERGGHPLEAVDRTKQRRICKTASCFLQRYGYSAETLCRFDVIGITEENVIHIEDAFFYIN